MSNEWTAFTDLQEESGELKKENHLMKKAILSVPEFIYYPYDWKQCIFCKGKREHNEGCIRERLEKKTV